MSGCCKPKPKCCKPCKPKCCKPKCCKSNNGCGQNMTGIQPCIISCPGVSTTPTFTSVTAGSVTAGTLTTDTLNTVTLSSTVGIIDNLQVEDITISQILERTQSSVLLSSFIGSIPVSGTGGIMTGLNTSTIGVFPGFTAGIMNLSGQTGILSISLSNTVPTIGNVSMQILKNGVPIFIDRLDPTEIDLNTLSAVFPVYNTDISVEVYIISALVEPVQNYNISIVQL